jgi:hypothetical protein
MRDDPPAHLISKSGNRLQQVIAGADYETQEAYDRGNQELEISFRTQRVFDTTEEAESYMLGYETDAHHPWRGTCIFYLDGASAKMRVMHDAVISVPAFDYLGCRVYATYTVHGGKFEAEQDQNDALWMTYGSGDLIPTGNRTPDAGQAWERDGDGNILPATSITSDLFWEHSAGNLRPA